MTFLEQALMDYMKTEEVPRKKQEVGSKEKKKKRPIKLCANSWRLMAVYYLLQIPGQGVNQAV